MSEGTAQTRTAKLFTKPWRMAKLAFSVPLSVLGWLFAISAALGLLSLPTYFVANACAFEMPLNEPYLKVYEMMFGTSTWWEVLVLVLFDLFMLVVGLDFIKGGRALRQSSTIAS